MLHGSLLYHLLPQDGAHIPLSLLTNVSIKDETFKVLTTQS